MKQWRYLEDLQLQIDSGQVLTQKETAKRIGCSEFSVAIWNRSLDFRRAVARAIREANEPLLELLHRSTMRRGIQGSVKHAELAFNVAGRLNLGEGDATGQPLTAAVMFVGLPVPKTAEERARLLPPPGSSQVLRGGVLIDATPAAPAGGTNAQR